MRSYCNLVVNLITVDENDRSRTNRLFTKIRTTVNLEQTILNHSKKVDRALETLRANRRYQQDKLTLGLDCVDRYVEDIEGDWLDDL